MNAHFVGSPYFPVGVGRGDLASMDSTEATTEEITEAVTRLPRLPPSARCPISRMSRWLRVAGAAAEIFKGLRGIGWVSTYLGRMGWDGPGQREPPLSISLAPPPSPSPTHLPPSPYAGQRCIRFALSGARLHVMSRMASPPQEIQPTLNLPSHSTWQLGNHSSRLTCLASCW